jgi:hypothetical protein
MRFFAGLLAYLVGVSVVIGIGIVGLMALQSPSATPTASMASTASNRERVISPAKPALPAQRQTVPDKKDKTLNVAHKRMHPVPRTVGENGAYGYAEEARHRVDPNFFFIFGR